MLLDQLENKRHRPEFHRNSELAHVRVTENYMEPAILSRVGVWLVSRIHNGPAIHRVDADQHTKKIRSLRDLKNSRLPGCALALNSEFARARINLAGDEKGNNITHQTIPGNGPAHQIVVVAAVTVTDKIGVILVQPDLFFRCQL